MSSQQPDAAAALAARPIGWPELAAGKTWW